jgi:hypothetical protein
MHNDDSFSPPPSVATALMRPNQVLLLYRYEHENAMLKQLFAAAEEIKRKYIKVQSNLKLSINSRKRESQTQVETKVTNKNFYFKPKIVTPPDTCIPTAPSYAQITASNVPTINLNTNQNNAVITPSIVSPAFSPGISVKKSPEPISTKIPPISNPTIISEDIIPAVPTSIKSENVASPHCSVTSNSLPVNIVANATTEASTIKEKSAKNNLAKPTNKKDKNSR